MLFLVVAVLGATALAEKEVYRISGAKTLATGYYVQIDEHTFQQLGGPNDLGYFLYLVKLRVDNVNDNVWNIGGRKKEGESLGKLKNFYTASGENDGPPREGLEEHGE